MTPENHKLKRALISVSDKAGIIDFAKELIKLDIEIFSTGGTAKALAESGIPVRKVSEITNFPEIMGGRVKTLHPKVHGALLGDLQNEDHILEMSENGIRSIDLLIVNLYPFEKKLKDKNISHEELVENIDIGGPAMIRAASKNYKWTAVVVNPDSYQKLLEELINNDNTLSLQTRKNLAAEGFSHTARYDALISNYFNNEITNSIPNETAAPLKLAQSLRYGENPHQLAGLYGDFSEVFIQLHGKELSYNNIIDIDSSARLISEFEDPTCVIVKHTNPCGVATSSNLKEAYEMAFSTDTVSAFGGIITFNKKVDFETVLAFDNLFAEVIIAPDYDEDALNQLYKKKNRRIIKVNLSEILQKSNKDLKSVIGGYLLQEIDYSLVNESNMKVVTQRSPSPQEMRALMFNWKVCKHVKSNAVVFGKENRTIGIGAGQMSRVFSSKIAIDKAKEMQLSMEGTVIASDAFFPFADGLIEAAGAGATAVIQPGGSVRDDEVIQAANEHNIAMIFTGMRHFKH